MLAQLLKTETRAAHHALDHHPLLSQLFSPELSSETYALILSSMRGVQMQCETVLANFAERLPQHFSYDGYLNFASRIPLIDKDLSSVKNIPQTLPAISNPISLNSIGSYIGMAYVIEGSALGGQHIARYLQKVKPLLPVSFFSSEGFDCKERWNSFWEFANAHCPENEYDIAVATAIQTFDIYRLQMDHYLANPVKQCAETSAA